LLSGENDNMVTNPACTEQHPATIDGVEHHAEEVDGRPLHWVSAGTDGSPVLLVHGFPETWWVFRRLIPLLAAEHRVVAVDLPGFGGSVLQEGDRPADHSGAAAAATLHALIARLGLGPVHLLGQDIAGNVVFRLAAEHPEDVRSLIAVETLVSGFGLERLADVENGGAWHIGAIATPGVAEFVFTGRMHAFLTQMWFPSLTSVVDAVTSDDVTELARAYSQPGAWAGPQGLYSSALRDGDELRALAASAGLRVPVLAVDGMGMSTTADGMGSITDGVEAVLLDGVGHHVALEAPERLGDAMRSFMDRTDQED
jgi:pimeloyl-ACP methyl ester carboxylesterase